MSQFSIETDSRVFFKTDITSIIKGRPVTLNKPNSEGFAFTIVLSKAISFYIGAVEFTIFNFRRLTAVYKK